ncbi:MAG TPA: Gfo/Idh/MocA family oxidoreductase [Gemmatimonadaceae bacterium]|nr:Gfo/Idh/MocA family oxidoreductase [Gemmatimonadaceae bacterium]
MRAPSAPLRVAVIGFGKMGQHHARAIAHLSPRARVVAVVDPAPTAADAVRQICDGATLFATPEEMLDAETVDVVHICTPPHMHEATAAAVLAAGCHAYVEKPFVSSVAAAERLLALADEHGVKLCAGHQLLYEAPAREATALLPALGRIVHVESFFSFRTVRRSPTGRAPLRADLQLLDILPHPVYLLLHVLELAAPDGAMELTAMEGDDAGTLHALVRRGRLTGNLVVTLSGRPVESYLRITGTNGYIHADFVRGTVQRSIGPGTSGIDKVLNPYRQARQLLFGTTSALTRRVLKRQRSYPGLSEIFDAFYGSIQSGEPAPMSGEQILETVRIWERVAAMLETGTAEAATVSAPVSQVAGAPRALITGGTGFLGKEVVRALQSSGSPVRVLARRVPAAWERMPGVDYVSADLAEPLPEDAVRDIDVVIHCAAETAGSWEEHQRNSIDTTERLLHAAAAAGVKQVIHVSSLAVLSSASSRTALHEESALESSGKQRGPYVWGKLESERRAVELGRELGLDVKIVRPGPLVNYADFEAPGRLGKRIGNIFVAVGSPRSPLGVADVAFAGRTIAWMVNHFDDAPAVLHLLSPQLPTRRELVGRLKASNPDLSTVWLPTVCVVPLSWMAIGAQKLLRPGKPAMNVAKAFASQRYNTARIARVEEQMASSAEGRKRAEEN